MDIDSALSTQLTAARTHLILDQPFLGALVLRLPMQAVTADWCPTTATDTRCFYYNPAYLSGLTLTQTQFVLAHEALHCALSHFNRRQHRQRQRWDLACDYAINPLLVKEGLIPPSQVWVDDQFLGLTAEEIYSLLDENNTDEPMDNHLYDKSDDNNPADQPPPLSAAERETQATQWQQHLLHAAQQALHAGKLNGDIARLINHLLQPKLPWTALLARYLSQTAREDYSYTRPSRREGDAILPHLRSTQIDVAIAIDVSGSIGDTEIQQYLAEIQALKGQFRSRITLLACDRELTSDSPYYFESWEDLIVPTHFPRGGGTSFRPVFSFFEQQSITPNLLIYFTDAAGEFPKNEPCYPVIWLVKGQAQVPWGERIQFDAPHVLFV
jgi:predicted metal-dependent peptidase